MQAKGVTCVIRSLMGGGAERVLTTMANFWVERGVAVSIITSVPSRLDAYPLDGRVRRITLACPHSLFSRNGYPWSIRRLRRAIVKQGHDVVISFMDRSNVPILLATRGLGKRVIIAERIDPRTQNYSLIRRFCMRLCYPWADALTVLTENVKTQWAERFMPAHKIHVIHNPVLPLAVDSPLPDWLPEKFICCVGRLHRQKGFDLLFQALPPVFARHPDVKLVILGEGPERAALTRQAEELGLAGRVFMPGFIHNPHAIVRRASLFVLPSRFEGFPNALIEAMSLARPVISYDCPSGPAYLIQDGVNGILLPVGEIAGLTSRLNFLLDNPEKASALGREALKVRDYCNINRVMEKWSALAGLTEAKSPGCTPPQAAPAVAGQAEKRI